MSELLIAREDGSKNTTTNLPSPQNGGFTPNMGKGNSKMNMLPVIPPRSHDLQVWSDHAGGGGRAVARSGVNRLRTSDLSVFGEDTAGDPRTNLEAEPIIASTSIEDVLPRIPSHTMQRDSNMQKGLIRNHQFTPKMSAQNKPLKMGNGNSQLYKRREGYTPTVPSSSSEPKLVPRRTIPQTLGFGPQTSSNTGLAVPAAGQAPLWNERRFINQKPQSVQHFTRVDDANLNGIDDEYWWDPAQLDNNLPSNLSVGPLEKDPRFADDNRYLYTQTIQPNLYTRNETIQPINSNIGISFNPQYQPVEVEAGPTNMNQWTFTRLDPQLVRDDVSQNRREENPGRDPWTAKMSAFEAAPGTVDLSDIYDPRFTGYGDPYRAYTDVNLGQVRYYYSDVDAYRNPNFVIRSNIDHMDFSDPMGAVKPEYIRTPLAENSRELAETRFLRDSIEHREDIMEGLMRKMNQEKWQQRAAPPSASKQYPIYSRSMIVTYHLTLS